MKLYIIKAFNQHGGCVTYYITATGVNAAKAALRAQQTWCKQVEVVRVVHDLIAA